jgi:ferredoxin-NADP reductase
MSTQELVVQSIDALTPRIRRLRLSRADGAALPPYEPGSHLELHVPADSSHPALHRAYSLVRPQADVTYEIAVQLEPQGSGGSRWVHDLQAGDRVTAGLPRNAFPLIEGASSSLLLAGGIGITPILCMANALSSQGHSFELHFAARSVDMAAYADEVLTLGGRCWFDGGDPSKGLPLTETIGTWTPGRHLYVCGPSGFIQAVRDTATSNGWPVEAIHFELFSGSLAQPGDQAFSVELRTSGRTLQVPQGRSVLEVLEEAGLDPMFDCRRGDCGVCTVQVLEGEADHRDVCLTERDRAGGSFCTCVSRARSASLVLDL